MSKKQNSESDLTISSGGFMSVDRVDALLKNCSLIRGMTLPTVPKKASTTQPRGATSSVNAAGNKSKTC
jgi:hypothetical protein